MACCGHKRAMQYGAAPARPSAIGPNVQPAAAPKTQPAAAPAVTFEYIGETGVSAVGGVTRSLYRFAGKRARVAVDARDAASIGSVPNLRRVG